MYYFYSYQPEIAVKVSDEEARIDFTKTVMKVDGQDVSPEIVDEETISYTPEKRLSERLHTVYIEVFDKVGNNTFMTWTFIVETDGPILKWEALEEVYAGSEFEVHLKMNNIHVLNGMEFIVEYDSTLLDLVSFYKQN